jgi:hypothetical protein
MGFYFGQICGLEKGIGDKNMKHTPGTWEVQLSDVSAPYITAQRSGYEVGYDVIMSINPQLRNHEANCKRIVECVNACEGIEDPSVVPEMLRVMKGTVQAIGMLVDADTQLYVIALSLSGAIARAEGKK